MSTRKPLVLNGGQIEQLQTGDDIGGGGGATRAIHQVSHGFTIGDVLYLVAGVYTKAKADASATAEVVGIVSAVAAGSDDFTLLNVGYITALTGLTAGVVYFLSPTTAGRITATEPTIEGHVSKPLLVADSTSSGYFFNMRGVVIGGGATTFVATFDNTNLAAGILTVPHNFGHQYCGMPTIIDNTGKIVLQDETTYTDINNLAVSLVSQGAITGTWRVIVSDSGASIAADTVSDSAYGSGWDGVSGVAPSKNAVYDKMNSMPQTYANAAQIILGTAGLAIPPDQLAAVPVKLGAWTAYTPTCTPSTGTFTNVTVAGEWTQIGKTVHFRVTIVVTDKGSGTGNVLMTLPTAAKRAGWVCIGQENATNGKTVTGLYTGYGTVSIQNYDSSSPLTTGSSFALSGTYEAA